MTTSTFTSVISHAGTTQFRAWGLELSNALTAIGFIKSGDTGQINWASVNRPGVNTSGGYEIRYLNDSLHGSAPIYVKLEFGTGSSAAYPAMWITIGTGSNSSGTITGEIIAREAFQTNDVALDSTVATKVSFLCMSEGIVWMAHKCKVRTSTHPAFGFLIHRTFDNSGTATADGFVYYRTPNGAVGYSSYATTYTFSTGYTITSSNNQQSYGAGSEGYTFMPYGLGAISTIVGGVPGAFQVSRHYHPTPEIRPLGKVVSSSVGDAISQGTQFDCTPLGATQRTFICLEKAFSFYDFFCPVWE